MFCVLRLIFMSVYLPDVKIFFQKNIWSIEIFAITFASVL